MQILVGWNDAAEAELIALYLNVGDNQVTVSTDPKEFVQRTGGKKWDAILMNVNLPDIDGGYAVFEQIRRAQPESPIVGACSPQEVYRIARFLTNGMRTYVIRDEGGDFVFLLHATLESAVEAVRAETEQKIAERLREEVESVRKLQESIIPRDIYCPSGYEICARYEPSQIQVVGGRPVILAGGDYYDVFSLDDQSIVVLVGDASGHGMKACMSIMTMHTLVRMIRGQQYQDTASFVAEVNRRLCEQSVIQEEGGFITLFYGVLRADRHEFQWTSAGHPVPLVQKLARDDTHPIGENENAGLPLGIYPDADYETFTFSIPSQSRLLLYSDGLVEAFREGREDYQEYGLEGVVKTLKRSAKLALPDALQRLFDDSHDFTGGSGRHDDTSVVLLQRA